LTIKKKKTNFAALLKNVETRRNKTRWSNQGSLVERNVQGEA
jgi:hypothetical protein